MELHQLKYFITVADCRSFTAAAAELFVSRQAVSKAIAQLEQELKAELFMRDSGGAFLSPSGLLFYDRVRSHVIELDRVKEEMLNLGNRYRQQIRIAFSIGTLMPYEHRIRDYVQRGNGNIRVTYSELPEAAAERAVLDHHADLAIIPGHAADKALAERRIAESPFGLLMRDNGELHDLDYLSEDDLRWMPLASLNDRSSMECLDKQNLKPQYTGYDLYRLFSVVREGSCAMLLPKLLVPKEPDLIWLPIRGALPWSIYMLTLRSMEDNVLYQTAADELESSVFGNET